MEPISDQKWTSPFYPSPYSTPSSSSSGQFETLPQLMGYLVDKFGSKDAFGFRSIAKKDITLIDGTKEVIKLVLSPSFQYITFTEVSNRINLLSRGLSNLGVKAGDKVMMMLETRMEWVLVAHAIARLGAIFCPLYHTLNDDQIIHCCNMTSSSLLITNSTLVKKVNQLNVSLGFIKHVIYIPDVIENSVGITFQQLEPINGSKLQFISYHTMMAEARSLPDVPTIHLTGDQVAMIMFTSGSTGEPKGVQIKHRCIIDGTYNLGMSAMSDEIQEGTHLVSYLPLAHIFEFTIFHYGLIHGCKIHFSSPHTLFKGGMLLADGITPDINLIQPDMIIIVPLLMEKLKKAVDQIMIKRGVDINHLLQYTDETKYEPDIIDLIKGTVNQLFGGKISYIITGSAPLGHKLIKFYRNLAQIDLRNGYGSSETHANGCVTHRNVPNDDRIGTGHTMRGTIIRLRSWKEGGYNIEDNKGEILIHSTGMAEGYYNNPVDTNKEFIHVHGQRYWCSGDIGVIHPDGQVEIIDRKKEIHKLNNGEYISLSSIEAVLRIAPVVDMVCLTSDSMNEHLVALVVPNGHVINQMKSTITLGPSVPSELTSLVMEQLNQVATENGLPKKQIPSFCVLSPIDWNPSNGLTTASLKVKRKAVQSYFQSVVDTQAFLLQQ